MNTKKRELFIFAALLVICAFSICLVSCKNQEPNKVPTEGYPDLVVENAEISQEYKDIAYDLAETVKDEFVNITKIPHKSRYVDKMREYLLWWAKQNNIDAQLDNSGCIYFDVPASPNYENYPSVMLQSHMDMVVTKDPTYTNFDPINSTIELDYDKEAGTYKSKDGKTNIGADDGQGMAIMMTIAKSKNIEHGPLRLLFTYDEEIDCKGSKNVSPSVLNSDYLINIDGCRAGRVLISSAGFVGADLNKKYETSSVDFAKFDVFKINVDGLTGGHSGGDIAKPRISGSAFLTELLKALKCNNINFRLGKINCGNALNAISNFLELSIAVEKNQCEKFQEIFKDTENNMKDKNYEDKDCRIVCEKDYSQNQQIANEKDSLEISEILNKPANGVIAMSEINKDIPDTSENIAIVNFSDGILKLGISYRSNSTDKLKDGIDNFWALINQYHLKHNDFMDDYVPAWSAGQDNKLCKLFSKAMKTECNLETYEYAAHGGLETAFLLEKRPQMQIISIGTDVANEHMTSETFYTKSIPPVLATLFKVLKDINTI